MEYNDKEGKVPSGHKHRFQDTSFRADRSVWRLNTAVYELCVSRKPVLYLCNSGSSLAKCR